MSFSIVDIPNGPTSDELTQETLELLSLKDDLSIAHLKKLGVQLEMNEETSESQTQQKFSIGKSQKTSDNQKSKDFANSSDVKTHFKSKHPP